MCDSVLKLPFFCGPDTSGVVIILTSLLVAYHDKATSHAGVAAVQRRCNHRAREWQQASQKLRGQRRGHCLAAEECKLASKLCVCWGRKCVEGVLMLSCVQVMLAGSGFLAVAYDLFVSNI